MELLVALLLLLILAAAVGAGAWRAARSAPTGVLAGIAALLGGAYFALVKIGQAIGEYEEERAGYDKWVSETDFFVGLALHMIGPAVLFVLVRLALRALADDAAHKGGDDGERA